MACSSKSVLVQVIHHAVAAAHVGSCRERTRNLSRSPARKLHLQENETMWQVFILVEARLDSEDSAGYFRWE